MLDFVLSADFAASVVSRGFRNTGSATIALIALLAACSPARARAQPPPADAMGISLAMEELVARASPKVVQIIATGYLPPPGAGVGLARKHSGVGSGAIVSADGHIITNAHVLFGADRIEAVLPVGVAATKDRASVVTTSGRVPARLVGLDLESDLALRKVERAQLPFLEFADFDRARPGQLNRNARSAIHRTVGGPRRALPDGARPAEWPPSTK